MKQKQSLSPHWNSNIILNLFSPLTAPKVVKNDNCLCSQWWKFPQNDDISISVFFYSHDGTSSPVDRWHVWTYYSNPYGQHIPTITQDSCPVCLHKACTVCLPIWESDVLKGCYNCWHIVNKPRKYNMLLSQHRHSLPVRARYEGSFVGL